uniref:uncharacterized protein LOC101303570 n=1 Tax=Fragaria vesca subsp. vesca TaxID=101020 RepID=UPI0005CA3C65|nr:PREDICTED: uncharacterized protein LOC101303570 [Fragaria vesca subsp. vesca]XP_011457826.1 PREDICTED: uncharacterized protein LOC101303570 [Fragaria vesca subsp. vesca]XP_011457827.1 PREDICTED: uncharacterized protein LOC101303570 [Fragaria vesca subsp. vesca]
MLQKLFLIIVKTQHPVACIEAAISIEHCEIRLETKEIEALNVVSEAPISTGCHAGKFQPKLRVKKGKENPNVPHAEVESTTHPPAHFKTGEMDEISLCAFPREDVHNHISPTFGDSIASNPTPSFQANAETTQLDEAEYGDGAHSEGVCERGHKCRTGKASTASNRPQKRKGSAADEDAKDSTSSKKSRKRLPRQQVDEPGNNSYEDSFDAENTSDFDGIEDGEHDSARRKRVPRKSKIPVSDNEPVQKCKRTKKAPDEPTKKFSHSTCRNRRRVDKSLIEMPEGQIDPQKIPLRDLIRLREYTECSEIKEAAKLKTQASNHRDRVSTSSFSLNYASFMKKPRPVKWSEQDTELFYEGIELFGSEFHMVALLFPGRTRDHIKFKHKKEKRQNPLRIDEALHHQPKDNSKYARVINEMLKVARQTQKSNSDELSDIIDLEEEELTQNNNEEVTTPELDKIEDMETDVAALVQHEEAAVTEVHSPMKSNQSGHGDDFGGWSDEF